MKKWLIGAFAAVSLLLGTATKVNAYYEMVVEAGEISANFAKKETVMNPGYIFNTKIKKLAKSWLQSNPDYKSSNSTVTAVKFGWLSENQDVIKNKWSSVEVGGGVTAYYKSGTLCVLNAKDEDIVLSSEGRFMFSKFESLKTIDFSHVDFSHLVNAEQMFSYCESLQSIDNMNWNPVNISNLDRMFKNCKSLTKLDLVINTSNANKQFNMPLLDDNGKPIGSQYMTLACSMKRMFYNCSKLTAINGIESWNTENVVDMTELFYGCSSLTSLDLSSWDTTDLGTAFECGENGVNQSWTGNMTDMFNGASKLKTIYADEKKWQIAANVQGNNMFNKCSALVGGNGTSYNSKNVGKEYARIDQPGTPGYLTSKNQTASLEEEELEPKASLKFDVSKSKNVEFDFKEFQKDEFKEFDRKKPIEIQMSALPEMEMDSLSVWKNDVLMNEKDFSYDAKTGLLKMDFSKEEEKQIVVKIEALAKRPEKTDAVELEETEKEETVDLELADPEEAETEELDVPSQEIEIEVPVLDPASQEEAEKDLSDFIEEEKPLSDEAKQDSQAVLRELDALDEERRKREEDLYKLQKQI